MFDGIPRPTEPPPSPSMPVVTPAGLPPPAVDIGRHSLAEYARLWQRAADFPAEVECMTEALVARFREEVQAGKATQFRIPAGGKRCVPKCVVDDFFNALVDRGYNCRMEYDVGDRDSESHAAAPIPHHVIVIEPKQGKKV